MPKTEPALDQLCVDTLRALSIDAVLQADSGHPGLPLGAAPAAWALWSRHLRHNPRNPSWPDRDRFVLSAGHGSMLLYSLLHLTGYDLPLDEIKRFRQWGSRTPGHPEHGLAPGVETTTGPLGQGVGNSVGLAVAEAHLAACFNRPGHTIVDHFTYVLAGDGDLMEGVAHESVSLAGHLRLGKLVVLYDSNHISLAAATNLAFTEDVGGTFEACGWHVQHVADGNDVDAIDAALAGAKAATDRPSLVVVRSHIGFGSPKQDTFAVHGSPLNAEEVKETKKRLGYPSLEPFFIPDQALGRMREAVARGASLEAEWRRRVDAYRKAHPDLAAEFERRMAGRLPAGWDADIPTFEAGGKPLATRSAGGKALSAIAARLPEIFGGSADLNPSTNTALKGEGDFQSPERDGDRQGAVGGEWSYAGRNIHYGVREHAMGAVTSGLALHGGLRPYTATFLTFSDYMRPAIRLAALMELPVVYVFTHDSIGLGEDGPTHQPIEHAAALRAIPHVTVLRPADANETAAAWRFAIPHTGGPVVLLLTRQAVPVLDGPADVARGGYVLADAPGAPELVLMATGSEVSVALAAREILAREGRRVRVVSVPSPDLFLKQDEAYRDSVLPPTVWARMAVEAGVPLGWHRLVGPLGEVVAIEDRFGASAPLAAVMEHFGFTGAHVAERARALLAAFPARAKALADALRSAR
jgi:transketolase